MNNTITRTFMKLYVKQTGILFLFLFTVLGTAKAQVYCSPSFASTACSLPPYIDFSLTSASFSGTTFCSGVPCPTNYGDYYATYTANLTQGNAYALTVNYTASSSLVNFDIFCGAWIDWNNDGTFDNTTERIMTSNVGPGGAITQTGANFTPTVADTFRLRVILQTGSNPTNPCTTGGMENGEAKDFKVVVNPVSVGNENIDKFSNLLVYPNPSSLRGIYIKGIDTGKEQVHIKLTDILGNTIEQMKLVSNASEAQFIDLSHTARGIYNIKINQGQSVKNIKVVLSN